MQDYPFLYHGTSKTIAMLAAKQGLKPRGRKKGNWPNALSHHKAVYLTCAYAPYYAIFATKEDGIGAILKIDTSKLDRSKLMADEDALAQVIKDGVGVPENLKARTRFFRNRLSLMNHEGYGAEWSLNALGNCTHFGVIPPNAIVDVLFCRTGELALIFEPTITTTNYYLLGGWYRNMSDYLFNVKSDHECSFRQMRKDHYEILDQVINK